MDYYPKTGGVSFFPTARSMQGIELTATSPLVPFTLGLTYEREAPPHTPLPMPCLYAPLATFTGT